MASQRLIGLIGDLRHPYFAATTPPAWALACAALAGSAWFGASRLIALPFMGSCAAASVLLQLREPAHPTRDITIVSSTWACLLLLNIDLVTSPGTPLIRGMLASVFCVLGIAGTIASLRRKLVTANHLNARLHALSDRELLALLPPPARGIADSWLAGTAVASGRAEAQIRRAALQLAIDLQSAREAA